MASEGQTTSAVEPGSANALNEENLQAWLSTALQLGPAAAAPTISKFNTGQVSDVYLCRVCVVLGCVACPTDHL